MSWQRLGRIFTASGQRDWMMSHASVPYAEHIEADLFRIYFTPRDAQNRSYLGWLEIELSRPDRILRIAETPLLGPGLPGSFDDCGTMGSWLVTEGGRRHHYYIGWNIRKPMPFHVSIGRASENTDGELEKLAGPILDRTPIDPWFCSNPCVMLENGVWRMWYLSGLGWKNAEATPSASYHVRYAESSDGINWDRAGMTAIDLTHPDEIAIARPAVVRTDDGYLMWYCYRGNSFPYRLGHARSPDGLAWTRFDDEAGLSPAASGWDGSMIAYPFVFDHHGSRYLLYCGDGFGRSGFGLAVEA